MDILKKYFPYSFKAKADISALAINIVIHIVVGVVVGFILSLIANLPLMGLLTGIVGTIVEAYLFVGIVLSALDYLKLLK